VVISASQMNKSAAPENRAGKDRSSARSRREGRARLCGGVLVCGGGVGGGVVALFGRCELTEVATDSDGEGMLGVDGASGVDDDGNGIRVISCGAVGEVRIGDCGGTCGGGELFTFLIVWTVRL
jgi:hypothetical protein